MPGVGKNVLPGLVAGDLVMVVPIAVAGKPGAHRVDHGRAADRGTTGIVDAKQLGSLRRATVSNPVAARGRLPGQVAELVVPWITIGVVLDEEVPGDGRTVYAVVETGALVSCFDQEDGVAGLGKVYAENAPAGAAPHDDIVIFGGFSSWGGDSWVGDQKAKREQAAEPGQEPFAPVEALHGRLL